MGQVIIPNSWGEAAVDAALLPMGAAGKMINVGEVRVAAEVFHRVIKPDILKAVGTAKTVGRNPDIIVKGGKIILKGVGQFKGKVIETGLKAADFFF